MDVCMNTCVAHCSSSVEVERIYTCKYKGVKVGKIAGEGILEGGKPRDDDSVTTR
jgi:hypothetical protein